MATGRSGSARQMPFFCPFWRWVNFYVVLRVNSYVAWHVQIIKSESLLRILWDNLKYNFRIYGKFGSLTSNILALFAKNSLSILLLKDSQLSELRIAPKVRVWSLVFFKLRVGSLVIEHPALNFAAFCTNDTKNPLQIWFLLSHSLVQIIQYEY